MLKTKVQSPTAIKQHPLLTFLCLGVVSHLLKISHKHQYFVHSSRAHRTGYCPRKGILFVHGILDGTSATETLLKSQVKYYHNNLSFCRVCANCTQDIGWFHKSREHHAFPSTYDWLISTCLPLLPSSRASGLVLPDSLEIEYNLSILINLSLQKSLNHWQHISLECLFCTRNWKARYSSKFTVI